MRGAGWGGTGPTGVVWAFTFRPGPPVTVTLRPLRLDDLDHLMTWVNDPEITRNFAQLGEISREQEQAWLERTLAATNERVWAIEDPDGTYLGNVGLHQIHWPSRNARLGIVVASRAHHGRGVAQAALKAVLDRGFAELGLHKIWAVHFHDNARMAHILGKLGFVVEGRLRDEYFHDGRYHDMLRHSILDADHTALRASSSG
jgi:diamine N-acetyltransferase